MNNTSSVGTRLRLKDVKTNFNPKSCKEDPGQIISVRSIVELEDSKLSWRRTLSAGDFGFVEFSKTVNEACETAVMLHQRMLQRFEAGVNAPAKALDERICKTVENEVFRASHRFRLAEVMSYHSSGLSNATPGVFVYLVTRLRILNEVGGPTEYQVQKTIIHEGIDKKDAINVVEDTFVCLLDQGESELEQRKDDSKPAAATAGSADAGDRKEKSSAN